MAMHLVAKGHFGVPQGSADAFILLSRNGIIGHDLAKRLRGMVGFRNIAIHEYQGPDLGIVKFIVEKGKDGFRVFCHEVGINILQQTPNKSIK